MKFLSAHPRLRFELILAGGGLLTGLLILPVLIYLTGHLMLGPYQSGGFGAFLKDIFIGLGRGILPVWLMVLGPYLLLTLLRAILVLNRRLAQRVGPKANP